LAMFARSMAIRSAFGLLGSVIRERRVSKKMLSPAMSARTDWSSERLIRILRASLDLGCPEPVSYAGPSKRVREGDRTAMSPTRTLRFLIGFRPGGLNIEFCGP
jgi:hypothetical protein